MMLSRNIASAASIVRTLPVLRQMSSAAGKLVNIEHRDEVAIVKMNRAPVNSLNFELMTELREAIVACESMSWTLEQHHEHSANPPFDVPLRMTSRFRQQFFQ